MPALRATSAAASSDICGVAIITLATPARRGSPGFKVSALGEPRCALTLPGTAMAYFRRIASASAEVVGSATVGPEAITQGSSPGTSEIMRLTTRAGAAAAASLPPLIADKCRRTQFISEMVAPLFNSALLMPCLSASVTPSAGSARSAEPPPEMRQSTRSSGVKPLTMARMRLAASRPAASGTGWLASTTSIRWHGAPWP